MADTATEILEKIKGIHEDFKGVNDRIEAIEKKEPQAPAELREQLEKMNTEITSLQGKLDEEIKKRNRPAPMENRNIDPEMELRHTAFEKFLRYGYGETGRASFSQDEIRALSPASDNAGQFLVPTDWEGGVLRDAYDAAAIRPLCNVGSTGRDSVFMPALQKAVVAWGRVNLDVSEQDLAAGGERLEIFDLKALVLIHNNTLEDADADIWSEISMMMSEAVAEAEDDAHAAGVGDNSPQGIVSDTRVQANFAVTGVAGALSDASNNGVDSLIDLYYTPKATYRRNGTFAMNSLTESEVRKFKDTNGQYLWQPPVQAGAPAQLLGRPVINPEGLPDVAANAFPVVFGDFRRGYKIRDRKGISVQRLVEKYSTAGQTGFLLTRRTGGQVVLPEAFALLKVSV